MIPKALDKITAADIESLVTDQVEEGRTIDFKRELPKNSDEAKRELRADVTSFANSNGGDLVFGIEEGGGVATAVTGLGDIDPDTVILNLEQIIGTLIEPNLSGFETRAILIPGKGSVVVLRVPKSWNGPHFVKINKAYRMHGRNSKGKFDFDAADIRSAITLSAELPERIRRWRDDRLAKVLASETPVPLNDGARLVLHLVPLSSFTGSQEFSARELVSQQSAFAAMKGGNWDKRLNIDGMVKFGGNSGNRLKNEHYCQVFRSGRVEGVSARIVDPVTKPATVSGTFAESLVIESTANFLKGLKAIGVPLPIVLFVSILGAKGAVLSTGSHLSGSGEHPIDRDMLLLPDVLIETYEVDVPTLLRPIFDAMWNAAGFEGSFSYDISGKYNPA